MFLTWLSNLNEILMVSSLSVGPLSARRRCPLLRSRCDGVISPLPLAQPKGPGEGRRIMQESFKARLQAGQAADGCFLEMFNPIAAEIVAQAGFDSVLIDLEHGPGSVLDAIGVIHAVQESVSGR